MRSFEDLKHLAMEHGYSLIRAEEFERMSADFARLQSELAALKKPVEEGEIADELRWLDLNCRARISSGKQDGCECGSCRAATLLRRLSADKARMEEANRKACDEAAAGNGDLVRFYERDFYVLSNFSAFRIVMPTPVGDIDFDTSEHAYHYFKFPGEDVRHVRSLIRRAKSAHEAFKLAEQYRNDRRADWDSVKLDVMRGILRAKAAQHEYVCRKLLATGARLLVEDSWRDDFWGWGPNKDGQNMLGKLWMEVRAELRAALPKQKATS